MSFSKEMQVKNGGHMKVKELFEMFKEIRSEKILDIKSTKLAYAINKNYERMNDALEPYRMIMPERIKDYRMEMQNAQKLTDKDELQKRHAEIEEEYKVDNAAFNLLIKEQEEKISTTEIEVDFHKIKITDLPLDLTPMQYAILKPMITED
jgi:aromatic ring-opening dioxygenase LigB subunit